jgi:hypothetical protein
MKSDDTYQSFLIILSKGSDFFIARLGQIYPKAPFDTLTITKTFLQIDSKDCMSCNADGTCMYPISCMHVMDWLRA